MSELIAISHALKTELKRQKFAPPVTHFYNPLEYAWQSHTQYLERYGVGPKEVLLLGMNPGPWGMAQTGVPFGEVNMVRDWLGIAAPVAQPRGLHPKRPILGFDCKRSEVSGTRLWGWAKEHFGTAEKFHQRFFVANYCPLVFMEESGRNRTPDKLPKSEQQTLFAICDHALKALLTVLQPQWVLGVGKFAAERIEACITDSKIRVGSLPHPSPANPAANRGWSALMNKSLHDLGVRLP